MSQFPFMFESKTTVPSINGLSNTIEGSFVTVKSSDAFIFESKENAAKVIKVKKLIEDNFNLSPRGIREMLKLNNPIYEITSAYGHFGRKPTDKGEFTWEKTDKIDLFKL